MIKRVFFVIYISFFLVLCYFTGQGLRESSKMKYASDIISEHTYEIIIQDVLDNDHGSDKNSYVGLEKSSLQFINSKQVNILFENMNKARAIMTGESLESFVDKGLGEDKSIFNGVYIEFGVIELPNKHTLEIETKIYKTEDNFKIELYRLKLEDDQWLIEGHKTKDTKKMTMSAKK